jgi:hypothetical protein
MSSEDAMHNGYEHKLELLIISHELRCDGYHTLREVGAELKVVHLI